MKFHISSSFLLLAHVFRDSRLAEAGMCAVSFFAFPVMESISFYKSHFLPAPSPPWFGLISKDDGWGESAEHELHGSVSLSLLLSFPPPPVPSNKPLNTQPFFCCWIQLFSLLLANSSVSDPVVLPVRCSNTGVKGLNWGCSGTPWESLLQEGLQPWLLCAQGTQFSPLQRLLHHLHSNGTSKLGSGCGAELCCQQQSQPFPTVTW